MSFGPHHWNSIANKSLQMDIGTVVLLDGSSVMPTIQTRSTD